MATYVNDLRLTELATGEGSGTWGTTTNTNLELIGEALGYGTQDCFTTDADATTTVADGASDPARAMYFKVTSSATLTATRVLTIAPNTVSRVMFIENATTGSQSITISQGSGANVTIATGRTAVVYLDGAGSGAAVVDALALVDPGVTDTLAEVLVAGNTSGGTGLTMSSGDDLTLTGAAYNVVWDSSADSLIFADNAKAVFGAGSDLQIYHDGSGSFVDDQGTGGLILRGTNLFLRSSANENYLGAVADDAVTIYHDNLPKLATTSTGIDVTGVITTDGMTTSADINFGDNDKAVFGDGSDLQIYHDGSNSIVADVGTGGLFLSGSSYVAILNGDRSEYMLNANVNGEVGIYYDNSKKLATTSTGIDVTGTIVGDGLTIDGDPALNGNVTITSTASGSLAGPYLTLDRNSSSPADSDLLGILSFRGRDDGANVADYGTIAGKIADVTNTTEDGVMLFTVLSGGSSRDVLTLSHNESVFNNGGADQDFRIESDNNANMLYLDAGNDRVGIGSTPNTTFHVIGPNQSGYGTMTIEGNADEVDPRLSFYGYSTTAGTTRAYTLDIYSDVSEKGARYDVPSGYYQAWTIAGSKKMSLASNGYLGINELSPDFHLHVNSGTTNVVAKFESTDSTSVIQFVDSGGNSEFGTSGSTARISPNGSYAVLEASQTAVVLNNAAQDTDFRVESVNQTHMLFVDGGNDSVNIGASDGNVAALHVNGEVNSTILRLTSGSSYQGLRFNGETTFGNGTVQILPVTIPGSGTANQYTYFNKITSGGTTNHHVVVENSFSVQDGEAVFNQDGNDNDFRVESANNPHMLFVNAGLDQVVIGSGTIAAPSGYHFFSYGAGSGARSAFVHGAGDGGIVVSGAAGGSAANVIFGNNWGTNGATFSEEWRLFMDGADDSLNFNYAANTATAMQLTSGGTMIYNFAATFNESGGDNDFRVESDTNTHMLFVDAGNDRVGINNSAPLVNFHVTETYDTVANVLANGTYAAAFTSDASGSAGRAQGILLGGTNSNSRGAAILGEAQSTGNNTDLIFATSASAATPSERMRITDAGDVGIGTGANIDEMLHVEKTSGTTLVKTEVGAGSVVGFEIAKTGATTQSWRIVDGQVANGQLEIYDVTNSRSILNADSSEIAINDTSVNLDFRVEGDTNSQLIFADAGTDQVGIGIAPSSYRLHVEANVGGNAFKVTRGSNTQFRLFQSGDGTTHIGSNGTIGKITLRTGNTVGADTEKVSITNSDVVINEGSEDVDFRVESDSNTHQLAVDAEKNNVQINNSNVVINSDNGSVIVAKGAVYYSQVLVMPSPYTGNVQIDLDYSNWGSNNVIAAVDVMILTRQFNTTSGIAMGKMFATNTGSGGQFVTFTTTDITTSNCTFTASSPNNYRLRLTVNPSNVTDQVSIVLTLPILATSALSEITAQIV